MENCLIKGPASFVIDGKIIICVYGRHDIGKTQTNNEVWDKLDCPKKKLEIRCGGREFKGYGHCKGVKVGVETFGDPDSLQRKWLEDLAKDDYKIIVAAARSHGQTVDNVKDIAQQYGYKIIWFTPLCTDEPSIDWKDLKDFSADTIMELIKKHII